MSVYAVSYNEDFQQNKSYNIINLGINGTFNFIHQQENSAIHTYSSSSTTAPSLDNNLVNSSISIPLGNNVNIQFLKFVVWGVLGTALAVLGFLGNTLSMMVLYRRQMRSSTSYYLLSLAIYDNGILLGMMIYFCLPALAPYSKHLHSYHIISAQTVIVGYPLSLTAQMGSIYTCVGFTVERFIAVCRPLQAANTCTRSRTVRTIILILIWSVAYNIPRFFHYKVQYHHDVSPVLPLIFDSLNTRNVSVGGDKCTAPHCLSNATSQCALYTAVNHQLHQLTNVNGSCTAAELSEVLSGLAGPTRAPQIRVSYLETEFGSDLTFKHAYLIYSHLIFMFLLPFLVILLMNIGLIQTVRGSRSIHQSMCVSAQKEHNLNVMLIAVIVVFLVCQFPTIIDNILVAVFGDQRLKEEYSYMVGIAL